MYKQKVYHLWHAVGYGCLKASKQIWINGSARNFKWHTSTFENWNKVARGVLTLIIYWYLFYRIKFLWTCYLPNVFQSHQKLEIWKRNPKRNINHQMGVTMARVHCFYYPCQFSVGFHHDQFSEIISMRSKMLPNLWHLSFCSKGRAIPNQLGKNNYSDLLCSIYIYNGRILSVHSKNIARRCAYTFFINFDDEYHFQLLQIDWAIGKYFKVHWELREIHWEEWVHSVILPFSKLVIKHVCVCVLGIKPINIVSIHRIFSQIVKTFWDPPTYTFWSSIFFFSQEFIWRPNIRNY